ncbi:MAG: hypothetical protein CBC24_04515 [Candidatus Pelagibacter sp. TMED64]|nr:5-formyltetrahydrofolate cyclo-ligase [Candidatus Pelagibacter sp.]OUU65805.1 MAG: hypothetical protein CBC24_04515 [Candidatus Pelagibacter sp. TMED64]|tara:strand:+ start:8836 stop:9159 length:324 start_codon:yes stop_codon:yes gene_type:complete
MKNYTEKEKKLDEALNKLQLMASTEIKSNKGLSELEHQKNQLIIEKTDLDDKYKELLKENKILKSQLEKVKVDINAKFDNKNQFNQKVDELNQETESLLDEIEKWQM